MAYTLSFTKQAVKELEAISEPYYSGIKAAIYALAADPRPHGYKKLKGRPAYRIRVGNYRIIYEILDAALVVEVIDLGHRKDIYQ